MEGGRVEKRNDKIILRLNITHCTLLKSALAITMKSPACSALVIQAFCPLSTQ